MPFVSHCLICNDFVFEAAKVVAFRRRDAGEPGPKMLVVDLDGRQPWSGIRCVCLDCAAVVAKACDFTPERGTPT